MIAFDTRRPASAIRSGTAAVELAILLPFLALVFSAAIDFGRIFYAVQVLDSAASAAALNASGTAWVPATLATKTQAAQAAAVTEGATLYPALTAGQVAVTYSGGSATVTVSYSYPLLTAVLVPSATVQLQRTCTMRVAPAPGS